MIHTFLPVSDNPMIDEIFSCCKNVDTSLLLEKATGNHSPLENNFPMLKENRIHTTKENRIHSL
jgi:hypothetical protein